MQTLIFLNGIVPGHKVIRTFLKKKSYIIAADGGANYLRKKNIFPDAIIGDLDSVFRSSLTFFQRKGTLIKKVTNQNKTDFEKCLDFCMSEGMTAVKVFGATSMRPDHTLSNFSVLKKYYRKIDIRLITEEFEIFFINNKGMSFKYRKGEIISLLAMPKATGVSTTGLMYLLKNNDLEYGVRDGTLNTSVSEKVTVKFRSGNILLFKKHFINFSN